ncbi:MAG: hypothetical protein H6Q17_400 [Bacteroidetes bacterium]|nr:hypothetical protein [Bacteroidota bacterium]
MKKIVLLVCLSFITLSSYSQVIKGVNARLFKIISAKGDTIHFLKTDSAVNVKKPVILFCQGSLPYPLIIGFESKNFVTNISNFNYNTLSKKYHIVMISMPHTPPVASSKHLNRAYSFVRDTTDEHSYDSLYLRDNYLDKYVERANVVIGFLKKQKWVDSHNISVFGHSQGSYIAVKLGLLHPELRAVGYSGGNPDGRFALHIRKLRRAAIAGEITEQESQKRINIMYDTWKAMIKGSLINDFKYGDPAHTWVSFTLSGREDLIALKPPVFIAYGTKDLESAESSELMPIYFEKAGKTNYKMNPVVGCGHNFEEYKADGSPDYDKMHWDDVMNNFVSWMEQLKKGI